VCGGLGVADGQAKIRAEAEEVEARRKQSRQRALLNGQKAATLFMQAQQRYSPLGPPPSELTMQRSPSTKNLKQGGDLIEHVVRAQGHNLAAGG
jgi:hypothetical protein